MLIISGEHDGYIGNISHLWDKLAFHRWGLCVWGCPCLQWWQRWDDVNFRTEVALPIGFPGQVLGQNFSERKITFVKCKYAK